MRRRGRWSGENPFLFRKKVSGFAALNRRMLPAGRLLVSCRTSGSLNRPLAALTSGAPDPLRRKPLYAVHPSEGGAGGAGYGEREPPFLL